MKHLKEYEVKTEWGTVHYEDPESGCHFDNIEDLLQTKILGHCGCGLPAKNLKLVHDMLIIFQDFWDKEKNLQMLSYQSKENWNEKEEKLKKYVHHNWKSFVYFFWYVMNDKRIMEHGSSVPGWICDNNFLEAIKLWHKEFLEENED